MKLPRDLVGEALAARLRKIGFEEVRRTGSHIQMRHTCGEVVTIPAHSPLKVGTVAAILRDVEGITGVTRSALLKLIG